MQEVTARCRDATTHHEHRRRRGARLHRQKSAEDGCQRASYRSHRFPRSTTAANCAEPMGVHNVDPAANKLDTSTASASATAAAARCGSTRCVFTSARSSTRTMWSAPLWPSITHTSKSNDWASATATSHAHPLTTIMPPSGKRVARCPARCAGVESECTSSTQRRKVSRGSRDVNSSAHSHHSGPHDGCFSTIRRHVRTRFAGSEPRYRSAEAVSDTSSGASA